MAGTLKALTATPAFLPAAVANIYTPPASTIFTVLRHIHIANVTAAAATCSLYIGATGGSAAGTEIEKGKNVPANDAIDIFFAPGRKMLSTDFLTGLASAATTLTIDVMGTQEVV